MSDVAVCMVVDSSLHLASQWHTIFTVYISNLLSRLHEGRSSDSFNIAIVTYASADYRPTPILAKRYFNTTSFVTKELKEDALKLGIGRTGSSAKIGMAALEGYAAALEMFDHFLNNPRPLKDAVQDKQTMDGHASPLCHIIHVSACPSDDSPHPLWNQTSGLDTLSWKTMPDELRKRNINLSMILLTPNKSFSELHSSVNPETHKAWFKAPNDACTLLLSSQTSWAPLPTKRANENGDPDKASDAKRARISPPNHPPLVPTPQAPPPSRPAEKDPPPSSAQSNPMPPQVQIQQVMAKAREMESQLKQSQAQVEMLRQQGRIQDMENLKRAMQPKIQMYHKLKQFILAGLKSASANSAVMGTANPAEAKPDNAAGPSGQNQSSVPGPSNIMPSQPQQVTAPQTIQQAVQAQRQAQQLKLGASAAPEMRQPPSLLSPFSPNIAAQMQKLQMKEGIQGLSSALMHQHQPQQQQGLANQQPQYTTNMPQQQPPGSNENQIWVGTISWIVPQVLSSMEAEVRMLGNANIQPQLWPSAIEVELLRDQAVSVPVLKEWMSRHKPTLCQIKPFARSIDGQENAFRFKSLSSLLIERNIYALGRRAPAGENVKPMLLLFPMGGDAGQLVAAVFPESGVPDLPRANPQAVPAMRTPPVGQQPAVNPNPQMLAMLQKMTPEMRMQFMARFRQQQIQMQQQAQAQAQARGAAMVANEGNGNTSNSNTNPMPIVPGPGGGWPAAGMSGGQNLPNMPQGLPGGMNVNLAQALAAMQQQRQGGMQAPPGSGGQPPF